MFRATMFTLTLIAAANPGLADEVTDTLSSALQAYEDGDIEYAIEELDYARQLLQDLSSQALTGYLPEPPAGWTREISDEGMNAGLAFLGGGVAAEAEYTDGSTRFKVTIMADNPMVAGFAPMIANAGLMGMKMHRVGREKFYENDDQAHRADRQPHPDPDRGRGPRGDDRGAGRDRLRGAGRVRRLSRVGPARPVAGGNSRRCARCHLCHMGPRPRCLAPARARESCGSRRYWACVATVAGVNRKV
ncbi:MAG: hypothetical protein R3D80_02165 [Paracoccaceae bacterium]